MEDKPPRQLLEEAKAEVEEVSVDEAHRLFTDNASPVFLDIREPEQLAAGYIKGSVFIRGDEVEMHARHLLPDKEAPVLLYCGEGVRSLFTALTLKEMGYKDVRALAGGFKAWVEAGYEIESDSLLTREQINHYSRQIILKEVGVEGQKKLLAARVLLVGAGGLGSPSGLYLAASGVGTLGIADYDSVAVSNLNRQIIHAYDNVGKPKVASALEALKRANPEINLIGIDERITPDNVLDIMNGFDIVLDGSDNFATKYLLNDACFFAGKPYVFGGATRFEGQASVFHPAGGGPCLRCIWPTPPSDGLVPT
jgi:molybdopterin/thiamine biosynthesis adenylyltransferase/rhodanese-related sulfurtransferase